ncbi:hypothetical protein LTS09_017914 [Friedmanniomyces endolithicus]|nr:hypothetical protein LTS09_017914 [Friedmanniomyces endolithicus]KAK0270615.1 hypothetical protein LTS00_016897 [Friedmanniomyces endolithicus]
MPRMDDVVNNGMRQDGPSREKQAACFECRGSKIKCVREEGETTCKKCRLSGVQCIAPAFHVGRYKGTKNKRTELEKPVLTIGQAAKRSRHNEMNSNSIDGAPFEQILEDSRWFSEMGNEQQGAHSLSAASQQQSAQSSIDPATYMTPSHAATSTSVEVEAGDQGQDIVIENADNPLRLLAAVSNVPKRSASRMLTPEDAGPLANGNHADFEDLDRFFEPMRSRFYENLSHSRWGLDPVLHTAEYVRGRSAYLFTSILAAAALFLPDASALSKRLFSHRDNVRGHVLAKRSRSVEIVLAFMVNIPWRAPSDCWSNDETCGFLSNALSMALDLGVNKIVSPSMTIRAANFRENLSNADCIDAHQALQIDGSSEPPTSLVGRRLLRARERIWLALFVLDRGVCLARGRPCIVPAGPLVESCDSWHVSDIADPHDVDMISMAVLRRDLVGLVFGLREICSHASANQGGVPGAQTPAGKTVKHLQKTIDNFFDHWNSVWALQVSNGSGHLPPYVEILATHTQLSTYCSVINHPTASSSIKDFFRAAGLKAALNVMRVAVRGEARLTSMPNNTVIMISFAACFALSLSVSTNANGAQLAPNAVPLVLETASVLVRIGKITVHRAGTSTLFGRHIRRLVSKSAFTLRDASQPAAGPDQEASELASAEQQNFSQMPCAQQSRMALWPDLTSAFEPADDQIFQAIDDANAAKDPFPLDESIFLDWYDWPHDT